MAGEARVRQVKAITEKSTDRCTVALLGIGMNPHNAPCTGMILSSRRGRTGDTAGERIYFNSTTFSVLTYPSDANRQK